MAQVSDTKKKFLLNSPLVSEVDIKNLILCCVG